MAYEEWVQREAGALRRILCFVPVYSSIVLFVTAIRAL
jgi:hypothetical protein